MINVENITFAYPRGADPVLTDFSARFERGEMTVIKGRNGCGKTTLTKLIVGILRPAAGRISIDGCDNAGMDLFGIGQRVGYVFQNPERQLFCDTVFNEVAFGLRYQKKDEARIEQDVDHYLSLFSLTQYRGTYPGKLSLGEKQRLALAAVMALGTSYLVLDEPGTGLDVRAQTELGNLLNMLRTEQNCGILLVAHSSGLIDRFADRELVMAQ